MHLVNRFIILGGPLRRKPHLIVLYQQNSHLHGCLECTASIHYPHLDLVFDTILHPLAQINPASLSFSQNLEQIVTCLLPNKQPPCLALPCSVLLCFALPQCQSVLSGLSRFTAKLPYWTTP